LKSKGEERKCPALMSSSRGFVGTKYIRKPVNWALWEEWLERGTRTEGRGKPSQAEQEEEAKIEKAIEKLKEREKENQ
jgi:hypothetical protein